MFTQFQNVQTYCPDCCVTEPGTYSRHPSHSLDSVRFPGVYLELDFISEEEEQSLMNALDSLPWDPSQSGRRKQVRLMQLEIMPSYIIYIISRFDQNIALALLMQGSPCPSLIYPPSLTLSLELGLRFNLCMCIKWLILGINK